MDAAYSTLHELTLVPPYQYSSDGTSDDKNKNFSRKEQLSRVADRVGARFGLTGMVGIKDNHFDIILELIDYENTQSNRIVKQRQGELAEIDGAVKDMAEALLSKAITIANPGKGYFSVPVIDPQAGELKTLAVFLGQLTSSSPKEKIHAYQKLWKENSHLSSVALLYMNYGIYYAETNDIRALISAIMATHPQSIALQTLGNFLLIQNSINGVDLNSQESLKELIRSNHNNIGAWLALSDSYTMQRIPVIEDPIDHHLGYASAIALAVEIIHRWPNYYRGWWSFSYNLYEYGFLVRGGNYWNDVPEENKNRYRSIVRLTDKYLNKTINSHPAQGALYANMISIDMAMGRDWKNSFYRAIELEPDNQRPYKMALNFSLPQWGGTKEDLYEIYRLAKKNNPNADWPEKLLKFYFPGAWSIREKTSMILLAIAIFIILILFYMKMKHK